MTDYTQSECRNHPEDLFVGPPGGRLKPESQNKAIAICGGCPIRQDCLTDALRDGEFDVVRGGAYFDFKGECREGAVSLTVTRICKVCETPFEAGRIGPPKLYCSNRCKCQNFSEKKRQVA